MNRLPKLGRKMKTGQQLLTALFSSSLVRPDKLAEITDLSLVSTYKLIEDFEEMGILKEVTGGERNGIYIFEEYYQIFR